MHTVHQPDDNPPPAPIPYFRARVERFNRESDRWAAELGLMPL